MIHTLTEQSYLDTLIESKRIANRREFLMSIDFSQNKLYTGNETIGEMLLIEGITDDFLTEGALSIPLNKLKSMVAEIGQNISTMEGLGKIKSKFGPMAKKVPPKEIENQTRHLAAVKGISAKNLNGFFEQTARLTASVGIALTWVETPFIWLLLLVFAIQSNDLVEFKDNIKKFFAEWNKAITRSDSEYERSFKLLGLAWKLIMICFIPPFIQSMALMPVAAVYILVGYILLILDGYKHLEKK